MADSNYGIDYLTKEDLENYINDLQYGAYNGYWGPVIEKDGKYYLTTLKEGVDSSKMYDDLEAGGDRSKYYEVTKVIDKSIGTEEAKKIFNDVDYSKVTYAKPTYNVDVVNEYISEVQSKLHKDVGKIDIHDDGSIDIYDLKGNIITKGTKIVENKESNATSKYDLSSIDNSSTESITIKLSDKLDDDNKKVIEGYLNQLTGKKDNQVVLKDGFYTANVNGEVIVFGKETTIFEAISEVNATLGLEKSIDPKKSLMSNKVRQKANNQTIFIDVPTFDSIVSINDDVRNLIDSAKGKYSASCLTDKLNKEYNLLVSGKTPTTELAKASDLVDSLSRNIKHSLRAYDNIDHNLGSVINSIIGEIFTIGKYKDGDTEEFYKADLDSRLTKVDQIIDDLSEKLERLKKEYAEKYPDGLLWFNNNITNIISGIGSGFGLTTPDDMKTNGNESAMAGQDILMILNFMQENDLISKFKLYSNDADWNSSGLADVYYKQNLIDIEYSSGDKYYEGEFLRKYLLGQIFEEGSKLNEIKTLGRNPTYRINYFESDLNKIKEYMKDQISEFESITDKVIDYEGNEKELKGFDLLSFLASDIVETESAISVGGTQVSNYKKYRSLIPYEADMQGDTYLEYLVQDWSKINVNELCPELNGRIQYMSQQELALYFMYKGVSIKNGNEIVNNPCVNSANASGYLDAMSDLINQRHGLEDAILRINDYNRWIEQGGLGGLAAFLKSGADGFSDGVEGFFNGIGNVVLADGKRSASDYRDIFMLSILGDSTGNAEINDLCNTLGINDMDSAFKGVLKRNYTVLKSVGSMTIPTIVGFASPLASKILVGLNALGSSTESAMQMQMEQSGETDAARAYLYGGLSALSSVAMNKLMSGIAGLNGNITPPQGAGEFINAMLKQGGRAVAGVFTDSVLRATILGQPIDISKFPEQSMEAIINGMLTAAIMNGATNLSFKLANGVVMHFSEKYNSFQEMVSDWRQQFSNSALGQKLNILKTIGGDKWQQQQLKYDNTIVGKWLKEDNGKSLMNLTEEADSIINFQLKDGQQLIFDPDNGGKYYIYDVGAESALALPNSFLNSREGAMHITPTEAEYDFGASLRGGEAALKELQLSRWVSNTLPELLKNKYHVPDEVANALPYKFKYYANPDNWLEFLKQKGYSEERAKHVAGIHNRESDINSVYVFSEGHTKHNTFHEGLHGCGNLGNGSRGLNEAVTELFATDISVPEGYVTQRMAYCENVDALVRLLGSEIPGLTRADFERSYFIDKSDASLRNVVDSIMGYGYYNLILSPAFNQNLNKCHLTVSESIRLNDAVDNLIDTYSKTQGLYEPTVEVDIEIE